MLCSPFVRSLKTLSESHVYDFCMYVSCVCHRVVVVVVFSSTLLYFCRRRRTRTQHYSWWWCERTTFLYSIPIVFFLFLFFLLFHVRACSCAHGCTICHFFVGVRFSPHLFRLTLVLTQYYLILSLFAEIVALSFFCLTLTLPSLHSVPSIHPFPLYLPLSLCVCVFYIQTYTQNGARECLCLLLLLIICVMIAYIVC